MSGIFAQITIIVQIGMGIYRSDVIYYVVYDKIAIWGPTSDGDLMGTYVVSDHLLGQDNGPRASPAPSCIELVWPKSSIGPLWGPRAI